MKHSKWPQSLNSYQKNPSDSLDISHFWFWSEFTQSSGEIKVTHGPSNVGVPATRMALLWSAWSIQLINRPRLNTSYGIAHIRTWWEVNYSSSFHDKEKVSCLRQRKPAFLFKSSFLALHVGTLISKRRLCDCLRYYCNVISCNMPPNKPLHKTERQ